MAGVAGAKELHHTFIPADAGIPPLPTTPAFEGVKGWGPVDAGTNGRGFFPGIAASLR